MLVFALLISAVSAPSVVQERTYTAAPPAVYAPPVVRPYEPPSSFGRQIAEGDADASVRTRPIEAPVAVEAYRGAYETQPTRGEISYDRGVEAARAAQNARMGPLDGSWRVQDDHGQAILDIVLSDAGGSRPVEGAWNVIGSDRIGVIDAVTSQGDARTITASIDGSGAVLRLSPTANGWTGTLTGMGRERSVTVIRP